MLTQTGKARIVRALHEREGAFLIPNPWDVGSARILVQMGFEALATTSAGFAATLGVLDGDVGRSQALEPVLVRWSRGFSREYDVSSQGGRWCAARGQMELLNLSARPQQVTLTLALRTGCGDAAHVRLTGAGLDRELLIDGQQGTVRGADHLTGDHPRRAQVGRPPRNPAAAIDQCRAAPAYRQCESLTVAVHARPDITAGHGVERGRRAMAGRTGQRRSVRDDRPQQGVPFRCHSGGTVTILRFAGLGGHKPRQGGCCTPRGRILAAIRPQ